MLGLNRVLRNGVFLALLSVVFCYVHPPPTEEFPHNAELDTKGNVFLFWKFDDKSVTFEVFFKTLGWVGFGFSPNGGMRGSDLVVGWVTADGKTYFHDRYAIGNQEPRIDKSQDWDLLSSGEKDGFTRLKFKRLRNTCDKEEDRELTEDTMRVIFAYHPDDPSDPARIQYHAAQRRGSRSLHLFSRSTVPELPPGTQIHEFTLNNFAVPAEETHYECGMFRMPDKLLSHKQHVIRFEPVFGSEYAEGIVHHMIIYFCVKNPGEELNGTSHECYTDAMPPTTVENCENMMVAWAVGGGPIIIPEHAGYPLGYEGATEFVRLEVHYENPQLLKGIRDSSGMRLYYTSQLRQHDYAILDVGEIVNTHHQTQLIPPQLDQFKTHGYCFNECLNDTIPPEGVNMFMAVLHGHLTVRSIRTRHWRNGVELPDITSEAYYDFNYQDTVMFSKEIKLYPTDTIISECTHETNDRVNMTVGGFKSRDEMCLSFIGYYPAQNITRCHSEPLRQNLVKITDIDEWQGGFRWSVKSPPELEGMDMIDVMNKRVDWTNQSVVDEFQKLSSNTWRHTKCYGKAYSEGHDKYLAPPVMTVPLPPVDDGCPKKPPGGSSSHNAPFIAAILSCMLTAVLLSRQI